MRIRGGMSLAAGVAVVVVVAGCVASPPPPSGTGTVPPTLAPGSTWPVFVSLTPTPSGTSTPEPSVAADPWPTYDPASLLGDRLECLGPGSPTSSVSQWNTAPLVTEADVSPEAQALRKAQSPGNGLGRLAWRRIVTTADAVLFAAATGAEAAEGVIAIWFGADPAKPGGWTWRTQGNCMLSLAVPADRSLAAVSLDPVHVPAAGDRVIHLLIRETACSGGRQPTGRVLPPTIRLGASSVTVLITVSTLPGPQDCVGVDAVPYDLVLPEPLGGRLLLDGSKVPAVPVAEEVQCCG